MNEPCTHAPRMTMTNNLHCPTLHTLCSSNTNNALPICSSETIKAKLLKRLQSIAITRRLRFRSARPADSRDASGVRHGDEAEDHEQDVGDALPGAGGDGAVVH
jgi:hypothetical protein